MCGGMRRGAFAVGGVRAADGAEDADERGVVAGGDTAAVYAAYELGARFQRRRRRRRMRLQRAVKDVQTVCLAAASPQLRLREAEALPEEWRCRKGEGGFHCGFDGVARCATEVQQLVAEEECP